MARKMKDSGIEWIGEIPEGWEVAPLKRFTSIQTGNTPSKTSDSNYYASTGIPWIKPDNLGYSHSISKTSEYLTSEGALCARIMPPNTVYVCCIGSLGKVGYSSISCACNQQINALIFNDLMFWKYGYYLTIAQESQYLLFGNGNVLQIINSTSQGNIACVLPPLENQHLIACYLDSVCSDIEVLISKTRSSIEEYKKLKQAVITQAVTKGVRGEREMKDSGVAWIGEIPKGIGTKRNDITDACRELIVTAYGEFANGKVYGDKNGIYCESKVFESVEFGYNKIVVERPQRDEAGNILLKRGKPVPDTSLRDTENVPLVQDIDAYFAREVLPYAPDAWIDHSKTKVGYEIPMTRYFYEYQAPEAVEDIVARITALEQDISAGLAELFHKEG